MQVKKRIFSGIPVAGILIGSVLTGVLAAGCGRSSSRVLEMMHSDAVLSDEAAALPDPAVSSVVTEEESRNTDSSYDQAGETEESGSGIFVYICGEVRYPGVYELPPRSRVVDAIEEAGGFTDEADLTAVNQARFLSDGEMLTIMAMGDLPAGRDLSGGDGTPGTAAGQSENEHSGPVNINTADASELMTLRGIGEAKAADIIAYREENGPFRSIEEIMKVSGIKSAAFNKIKDDICVS